MDQTDCPSNLIAVGPLPEEVRLEGTRVSVDKKYRRKLGHKNIVNGLCNAIEHKGGDVTISLEKEGESFQVTLNRKAILLLKQKSDRSV